MVDWDYSLELATISQTLRCLNSPDDIVRGVARDQLKEVVKQRTGKEDPSLVDCGRFINSRADTIGERRRRDVHSLWTEVRRYMDRVKIVLDDLSGEWMLRGGPEITFFCKR